MQWGRWLSKNLEFKLKNRFLDANKKEATKAELPKVGIFFALNFLPWEFLLIKKLEIDKTKTTQ